MRTFKRNRLLYTCSFVILSLLAVLLCSCNGPVPSKPKIKIGYLPIAAGLPLFVAVEKEYFSDAGFDVELIRFASSNDLGTAATTGNVDALMPFALNAGFDIGAVSGKRHRLFGINIYSDQSPHIVDYFVARQNSQIKALADLKGRRVAGFPGSVTKVFVENILKKEGVDPKDYSYIELAPKDWMVALETGSVDAASVMEPQASQIISKGVGRVIVNGFFAKLTPEVPLSGHWLAEQFVARQKPEIVRRFVSAFDKAVDFIRAHPDEAKGLYIKYIGVDEQSLKDIQLNQWQKSSELDIAKVQAFADLLVSYNAIQQPVDVRQYILQTK